MEVLPCEDQYVLFYLYDHPQHTQLPQKIIGNQYLQCFRESLSYLNNV